MNLWYMLKIIVQWPHYYIMIWRHNNEIISCLKTNQGVLNVHLQWALTSAIQLVHVGVLAIQRTFIEHNKILTRAAKQLGWEVRVRIVDVREPYQLKDLTGLVIPGGESTTMSLFLGQKGFAENLKILVKRGIVMGTCAGLILLSNELEGYWEARWTSLSKLSNGIGNMFYCMLHEVWISLHPATP